MCKVDDLIARYDLSPPREEYNTFDEYLLARWKGEDGMESDGYKALTDWFNKQVLTKIYEAHGRDIPAFRIDSEYEILMGDQDLQHDELAADLAADHIDIEAIRADLISWSTMRRHLKECLDGKKEQTRSTSDWELESVEVARLKTIEKARMALQSLSSKHRLPGATKANIDIQVKLSCPECAVRVPIEDAVERGYVCKDHFQTIPEQSNSNQTTEGQHHTLLPTGMAQVLASLTDDLTYMIDFATTAIVL